MTKIKILEMFAAVFIVGGVIALIYLWTASPLGTSDKVGLTMAISTVELVIVTGIYAWHTRKMAEEMKKQRYDTVRPIIDILARTDDNDEILSLALAAEHSNTPELPRSLPCILRNVGLGPAIDVSSFVQPPFGEQYSRDFRTLAIGDKTEEMSLSLKQEDNRKAIVVYYKDVHGNPFKSGLEVKLGQGNTYFLEFSLKSIPVKENKPK